MSAVSAGFLSPLPPGGAQLSGLGLPWSRDCAASLGVPSMSRRPHPARTPAPFLPFPRLPVVSVCSPACLQPLAGFSPQLGHRIVRETRPVFLLGLRPTPTEAITPQTRGVPVWGPQGQRVGACQTRWPCTPPVASLSGAGAGLGPDSGLGGRLSEQDVPLAESHLSWGSEAAWPRGSEPCPQCEPRPQRSGRPSVPISDPGPCSWASPAAHARQSGHPALPLTSLSLGSQLSSGHSGPPSGRGRWGGGRQHPPRRGSPRPKRLVWAPGARV